MRETGLKIDIYEGLEKMKEGFGLEEGDDIADLYLRIDI